MTNTYLSLTCGDFQRGIAGTIPRGYAWNVSLETVQGQVWVGIAAGPHVRAGDLSERESDPGQAATSQQQAAAMLGQPVTVQCTSLLAFNGAYPIDQTTQM